MLIIFLLAFIRAVAIESAALPLSTQGQCQSLPDEPALLEDASPANYTMTSATALGDEIDDRLMPIYRIRPDVIVCSSSTYMTVVRMMVAYSIRGYLESVENQTFSFPDYANLIIAVHSEGSALQIRHIVLGLYRTVKMMTLQKRWNFLGVDLYWFQRPGPTGRSKVGDIVIAPEPLPQLPLSLGSEVMENVTTMTQRSLALTETDIFSNLTTQSLNGTAYSKSLDTADWEVVCAFRDTRLLPQAMFMALLTAFVRISPFPATRSVQPFTSTNTVGGKTKLTIDLYQPHQDPGHFQYFNVALMLGQIPERVWAEGKFQEVDFTFKVGGFPVGKGSLENWRTTSAASEEA